MILAVPLSDNIHRIRMSRGLTQQQVAERAGLTRIAFRDIENGSTVSPRVGNLQAIAQALGSTLQELLSAPATLTTVRFRTSQLKSQKDRIRRKQVVMDVGRWLRDFNGLERILGRERAYKLAAVAGQVGSRRSDGRAKTVAAAARKVLGLTADEPIRDISGLLESAGVKVHAIESPLDGLYGLSVAGEDGGPAVIVNIREDIPVERRIFTAAHELGHLLMHPKAYDVEKVQESQEEEREADVFASHFLMPEDIFGKQWQEIRGLPIVTRVLHTKRIFRVSHETVLVRLLEKKWADQRIWTAFQAEYKRRFGRTLGPKEEPEPLSREDFVEDHLSTLVRAAVESEAISLSRGAEILGLDLASMRERAASWEIVQ